jgi:hypothetical protein
MSAIAPTKNTGLIIDEFINYATKHLTTVSGLATTLSTYPPAGATAPGVVNWTGYSVTPAKPSVEIPAAAQPTQPTQSNLNEDEGEDPFAKGNVEVEYPITKITFGDETEPEPIEEEDWDTVNNGVDYNVAKLKAETWIASGGFGNQSFSKAIGIDYSGYTGGPLSATDTIKTIYVPVLNKVHADKSRGARMLMTAQTQLEGFFPASGKKSASLSFRTNNPGNVGTNGIGVGKFATLADGITAQWNKVLGPIFSGNSKYYKSSYTLYEYLSTYAPVMARDKNRNWYKTTNNPTNYTNFVINYFKGQGYTITAQTTLAEINKIT